MIESTGAKGKSTTAKGKSGEDLAVLLLEREGYVVVGRNVRVGRMELDVIARDGDVLCFIEVRLRRSIDHALLSVTSKKQAQVAKAAAAYLAQLAGASTGPGSSAGSREIVFEMPKCRFDVVVVAGDKSELLRNAFEAPE